MYRGRAGHHRNLRMSELNPDALPPHQMTEQICRTCHISKPLDAFAKDSSKRLGRVGICRECYSIKAKAYYTVNSEKKKAAAKTWHHSNRKRASDRSKAYRSDNKERLKSKHKERYESNRDSILKEQHERYWANRKQILLRKREDYHKYTDRQKDYREANKDKVRAWKKKANVKDVLSGKNRARKKINNAVRFGKVIKPGNCSRCGAETIPSKLHAHHKDYNLPLDVEWLCVKCHAAEHRVEL